MSDAEAQLVGRCLKGDAQAMQALVDRFQPEVFGLCVRLLHHRQDAEDVAQEVFLRVFRSLRRWDSQRPLRPWIMGITVNRCKTWMGQRRRRPEPIEYVDEIASTTPLEDGAELAREIQAALQALRVEYRGVFILYHEQGLPYDEIAQAVRKPIGTVKTWMHRARLEIMDHLRRRGMVTEVEHELP